MPTPRKAARKQPKTAQVGKGPNQDVEVEDVDEQSELIPYKYSITAYGADYPVDSIVKRMKANDIVIPRFSWKPEKGSDIVGFQREYVWPRTKADRFIESLLLGLPVPGIFLVKEPSGRLLVLDGHQRLHTIKAFYDGVINGEEYRLDDVQPQFATKRYSDLDTEDRRRLDDSIMHATVMRQDEPEDEQSSIYLIFERLNTGAVNLQPQEIRVALYHGDFLRILVTLNKNTAWRKLFGGRSKRLKDMEMILRFFAFYYDSTKYKRPMKEFLNHYMAGNRDLKKQSEKELTTLFEKTTTTIQKTIGEQAFRPLRNVNAAVMDSLMTGVARRLAAGPIRKPNQLRRSFVRLISNRKYINAVLTATSDESNVKTRLKLATKEFASVK